MPFGCLGPVCHAIDLIGRFAFRAGIWGEDSYVGRYGGDHALDVSIALAYAAESLFDMIGAYITLDGKVL